MSKLLKIGGSYFINVPMKAIKHYGWLDKEFFPKIYEDRIIFKIGERKLDKKDLFKDKLYADKKWKEVMQEAENKIFDRKKISAYMDLLNVVDQRFIDESLINENIYNEFEEYKVKEEKND